MTFWKLKACLLVNVLLLALPGAISIANLAATSAWAQTGTQGGSVIATTLV